MNEYLRRSSDKDKDIFPMEAMEVKALSKLLNEGFRWKENSFFEIHSHEFFFWESLQTVY